jgi:ribose transport system permease protein
MRSKRAKRGPLGLRLEIPVIVYLLVALVCVFSLAAPRFAGYMNFCNVVRQGSVLLIVTIGMLFVIASGGIDLSVGSLVGLAGTVVAVLLRLELPLTLSIVAAILACAFCGFISGVAIAKGKVYPFVATFGMMFIGQGISLGITKAGSIHIDSKVFHGIGNGYFAGVPIPLWVTALVVVFAVLLWTKTSFGPHICAIGGDETAAFTLGINVVQRKLILYAMSGGLAGIAGILLASRVVTGNALIGQGLEFDAIASVVIGGTALDGGHANVGGAIAGAIAITVLRNGLTLLGYKGEVISALTGLIILASVAVAQFVYAGGYSNVRTES